MGCAGGADNRGELVRAAGGKPSMRRSLLILAAALTAAPGCARLTVRTQNRFRFDNPFEAKVTGDLPPVRVDPVLFEQVLFNLLDNAAKYAPTGTTISIKGVREQGAVLLQIIDEGGGIPPTELESVFDKFYRAQKGDHVRPGTGLGLAISRGFVEAMHGTISAANRADSSGAIITIRLPVPAASDTLDTAA